MGPAFELEKSSGSREMKGLKNEDPFYLNYRRNDFQHNDIQHNDTQQNDAQHNNVKSNGI
jgi:hypothetical protein